MASGFALIEILPDTEDRRKALRNGKLYLYGEFFIRLSVILAALRVPEDGISAADR